ncbi:hypothetical protein WAI453_003646 [Rhynchosporium graminicola]
MGRMSLVTSGLSLDYFPERRKAEHFLTLVKSDDFAGFIDIVKPHIIATPSPQIYETDISPALVFGGEANSLQGMSLNREEKLWIGVLGWESMEVRIEVLSSEAVGEAKKAMEALVWNSFLADFPSRGRRERRPFEISPLVYIIACLSMTEIRGSPRHPVMRVLRATK